MSGKTVEERAEEWADKESCGLRMITIGDSVKPQENPEWLSD